MKVDRSRHGLIRGVVVYSQWRAGCVSIDRAKDDDCLDNGVAYTPWHRHEEDHTKVETELDQLSRFYSRLPEVDGVMYHFEYRPYRTT